MGKAKFKNATPLRADGSIDREETNPRPIEISTDLEVIAGQVQQMTRRMERRVVSVDRIRQDGGTQGRVSMDDRLIETYQDRIDVAKSTLEVVDQEEQPFDPVLVYEDASGDLWLADGFHRIAAARLLGLRQFQAEVYRGTQRDAFLASLGVNESHGKRRTNADKRRAVESALRDDELQRYSDRRLAQLCKVSHPLVSKVRNKLEKEGEITFVESFVGRDGEVYESLRERPKPRVSEAVRLDIASPGATIPWSNVSHVNGGDFETIIATPNTSSDLRKLLKAVPALMGKEGRLVVLLPQESELTHTAFAKLSVLVRDHGFSYARIIVVFGRPHVLMTRGVCDVDVLCDPNEVVSGSLVFLGESIDSWQ